MFAFSTETVAGVRVAIRIAGVSSLFVTFSKLPFKHCEALVLRAKTRRPPEVLSIKLEV